MAVFLPWLGAIDDFLLHCSYAPVLIVTVPVVLSLIYPQVRVESTAWSDTTLILAAGAGVSLGHWLSYQYGFMKKATTPPPYDIIPPTWNWAGLVVLRMTIGVAVLLAVRAAVATLVYRAACFISRVDHRDVKAARRLVSVELPYKFVTYATISIGMVYAAPAMFRAAGIERETFFTEI